MGIETLETMTLSDLWGIWGTEAWDPMIDRRLCGFYNGYILTANPKAATKDSSYAHRLFALYAVFIDPTKGEFFFTYPYFNSLASRDYINEIIPLPGASGPAPYDYIDVFEMWGKWERALTVERRQRIISHLDGQNPLLIDLQGRVATPGLIDDHFHITPWSKKLPDQRTDGTYKRYGSFIDASEPQLYYDESGAEFANSVMFSNLYEEIRDWLNHGNLEGVEHLNEQGGLNVHGLVWTDVNAMYEDGYFLNIPLYRKFVAWVNHDSLSHWVQDTDEPLPEAPIDPESGEPYVVHEGSVFPPVLVVHVSGQMCWFNLSLLRAFNFIQAELCGRVDAAGNDLLPADYQADVVTEPHEGGLCLITVLDADHLLLELFAAMAGPFSVDVICSTRDFGDVHVPYIVERYDPASPLSLTGRPLIQGLHDTFVDQGIHKRVELSYRPICESISEEDWISASDIWGGSLTEGSEQTGWWDPSNPHGTNWYHASELGILHYDYVGGQRKLTGYGEHYVIRDLLGLAVSAASISRGVIDRRNLAKWAHLHGLTTIHDIMYYRRATNIEEFISCEALSYHRPEGFTAETGEFIEAEDTGHLNLRTGLYYYIENAGQIEEVLALAHSEAEGSDVLRLRPEEGHAEYPGWLSWLGWKLQLDGAAGARTLCSNAMMVKAVPDAGEMGSHSFGLLTMSNNPETIFTGDESSALRDINRLERWSWIGAGISIWLELWPEGIDLDLDWEEYDPASDFWRDFDTKCVDYEVDGEGLSVKIAAATKQVADAYQRTLNALARIWVARSSLLALGGASIPLPAQVVCHCFGDGAVDLWIRAIWQLKQEVEMGMTGFWNEGDLARPPLPLHWANAFEKVSKPEGVWCYDMIAQSFDNERYRVEHLFHVSSHALGYVNGSGEILGLNQSTPPDGKNIVLSTQPVLLVLDGGRIDEQGFPRSQEIWPIPHEGDRMWGHYPINSTSRMQYSMPVPIFRDREIPYTLNTDPPSQRDPRPALTILGAVARTPVAIDPYALVDEGLAVRPPDYPIKGFAAEAPLGVLGGTIPSNPMQITVEEALCAMTHGAAYVSGQDGELGSVYPFRFADLVVWESNPLAWDDEGQESPTLWDIGHKTSLDASDVDSVNRFIRGFRSVLTVVGGKVVYARNPG